MRPGATAKTRTALAAVAGVLPATGVGALAGGSQLAQVTRTAWADAAFHKSVEPDITSSCNTTTHKYAQAYYRPTRGLKQFSGIAESFHTPAAWVSSGYPYSALFIHQEMWLSNVAGQSWTEAGWMTGQLWHPTSRQNSGLFYARSNLTKGYAAWWFPHMPRTIKASSKWRLAIVKDTATRWNIYEAVYSKNGTETHSSNNYTAGFGTQDVADMAAGLETTCWTYLAHLNGSGPANGGHGYGGNPQSVSVKSSGYWTLPTTYSENISVKQSRPCHLSWMTGGSFRYEFSVRESRL